MDQAAQIVGPSTECPREHSLFGGLCSAPSFRSTADEKGAILTWVMPGDVNEFLEIALAELRAVVGNDPRLGFGMLLPGFAQIPVHEEPTYRSSALHR